MIFKAIICVALAKVVLYNTEHFGFHMTALFNSYVTKKDSIVD